MASNSSNTYPSTASGSTFYSSGSREHREYAAAFHTSTSTTTRKAVVVQHNKGIEEPFAPTPSSYGSQAYRETASTKSRSSSQR
ncbi:hypothetical protein SAPIO_CDS4334 [Scedosporium apiospermum]|uniref:Uncharacterized protein n=1 Tax=Pseudallescheria apiosperma TaxID=563466 RepID=A0A084G8P9_PSEDA|nr:uncharacterized protein SAPIO_CDS4334 [Scedosporium apiospermum]KEZ43711.1 hypothetical protein SAPIO_CDS4334 [Scedosporium apiospermum]